MEKGSVAILAKTFTVRELRLIRNCMAYQAGDPAGLPGHNIMVIVAKLLTLYDVAIDIDAVTMAIAIGE